MDDITWKEFDIATNIEEKPSISSGKDGWKRRYRRSLLRYWIKSFDIGPDIEWQRQSNLNIGADIEGFLFDIEYQPSISMAHEYDIE